MSTDLHRATRAGALCAAAMIAQQVGGKATRDALFLSSFSITSLPNMLIASALASVLVVLATARSMERQGPFVFVPRAFLASAVLLLAVWALGDSVPRVTSVLVYLHIASFGAVLASGFWSAVNERFDPRAARRQVARIAAGGTLGGLVGGLLAERTGAWLGISAMLPILAALNGAAALSLRGMGRPPEPAVVASDRPDSGRRDVDGPSGQEGPATKGEGGIRAGLQALARVPYLRDLAALVLTVTLAAAFLDYVLKAQATAAFQDRDQLARFFAGFYTAVALVTFLVQTGLSRTFLERLGLARTVATLPIGVTVGAVSTMAFPGVVSAALARGGESALRSSLFRSGYEPLYTPLAPERKRASKTFIDVGFDRLGDAVGGGLIRLLLWLIPAAALSTLGLAAAGLGLVGVFVAYRLHRGYVKALAISLESKAWQVDLDHVTDRTTRTIVMQSMSIPNLEELRARLSAGVDAAEPEEPRAVEADRPSTPVATDGATPMPATRADVPQARDSRANPLEALDPLLQGMMELRGSDPARIRRLLTRTPRLEPAWIPQVISLLAWDEVAPSAIEALRNVAPRAAGQLLDALLDPNEEFAIRRRVPRTLSDVPQQRVVEGLLDGLQDKRFEVRYHCGRTLAHLHQEHGDLVFDRDRVFEAVLREAAVDRRVWGSHRLLDRMEDQQSTLLEEDYLRSRSNQSLEHVFTMLSLVLPQRPLTVAYRGLLTDDQRLRGTALEYLENVLPPEIRESLWPFLDAPRGAEGSKEAPRREEILDELMRSNASIEMNLQELRRRARSEDEA